MIFLLATTNLIAYIPSYNKINLNRTYLANKKPHYDKKTNTFRWIGTGEVAHHVTIPKGQIIKLSNYHAGTNRISFKHKYNYFTVVGEFIVINTDNFFHAIGEGHLHNKTGIQRLKVYKEWKKKVDNS